MMKYTYFYFISYNERHSNLLKVISKTNKDKQSCMQNFAKGEAKLGYLKKRGAQL